MLHDRNIFCRRVDIWVYYLCYWFIILRCASHLARRSISAGFLLWRRAKTVKNACQTFRGWKALQELLSIRLITKAEKNSKARKFWSSDAVTLALDLVNNNARPSVVVRSSVTLKSLNLYNYFNFCASYFKSFAFSAKHLKLNCNIWTF